MSKSRGGKWAYSFKLVSKCRTKRPEPAPWLRFDRCLKNENYNTRISYTYWMKLYWATPPWLTEEMRAEVLALYASAKDGEHVDHIVPLKNPLVCGLHVPWNLRVTSAAENLHKSNNYWPDMPFQQLGLI